MAGGMCQKALDQTRSNGRERTESKCREDMILICGTGLDLQHVLSIALERAATESLATAIGCSWLKGLTEDPDCRCTRCQGTACPLNGRPQREVKVGPDKLEVGPSFCYLGDMLSAAAGCALRPQHA